VEGNEKNLEKTHLRLAALQTQILRWGMKTCADEMKEKVQDLRIKAMETILRSGDL
jgi:hypothetical protein